MSADPSGSANPCVRCGACCATYRVSFYWSEAEANGLPAALTEKLSPWTSCMAGTNRPAPRCLALRGEIGADIACSVYTQRPSPCRELQAGDEQCHRARAHHGLPPLSADDFIDRPAA